MYTSIPEDTGVRKYFFSRYQGDGTSNRAVILFRLINLRLVMESGAERRFVRWEQRERLVGQH